MITTVAFGRLTEILAYFPQEIDEYLAQISLAGKVLFLC